MSGAMSGAAYRVRALSPSGAVGSTCIGTAVYAGGGATWFLTLLTFFITSSALGRVGRTRKAATKDTFDKTERRDLGQAIANGGVAAVAALAYRWSGGHLAWAGTFVGALAACNADTWATEIGILSAREPWLITTLRRVARGTSGGISPRGLAATAAGGAAIGLAAGLAGTAFHTPATSLMQWILVGVAAGVIGSLFDSFLGATGQVMYYCPACDKETERVTHGCGRPTEYRRGVSWLTNDWVNACASAVGGLAGAALL